MLKLNLIYKTLKAGNSFKGQYLIGDVFVKIHIEDVRTPLIYTFSNASDITQAGDVDSVDYSPWGFEFVKKRGLNVIGFSAFGSESWYRGSEFHLCLEENFSEVSKLFRSKFSYGSSMGGFGASVFADILGVDKLLLINPISTLNKELVPFETRFKYGASLDWNGKYNDGTKNRASGYVVFDPLFDLDSKHAKRYKQLDQLKFSGVGHAMPAHLQKIGVLGELFNRFFLGDVDHDWFYSAIRKRREYGHYYSWLMSNQNIHLTKTRKLIINNYFLKYELECLRKKIINKNHVDIIRDAALKLERVDLASALQLMELALYFRPEGKGIQRKVVEYYSSVSNKN